MRLLTTMADPAGTSESTLSRSDTTATDNSAQSMENVHQSSGSHNPTSSTNSTGSEPQMSSQPRPGSSSGVTGRRRKVPDSVTLNACINCKKARAKVSKLSILHKFEDREH